MLPRRAGAAPIPILPEPKRSVRVQPSERLYAPDGDGQGQMFHPATAPTQADIEQLVEKASRRILRFWG
jgi:hypothetical protein